MKILKVIPAIMSLLSMILSVFKKRQKPEQVKKDETKIKEAIDKGNVERLNEELGWKD